MKTTKTIKTLTGALTAALLLAACDKAEPSKSYFIQLQKPRTGDSYMGVKYANETEDSLAFYSSGSWALSAYMGTSPWVQFNGPTSGKGEQFVKMGVTLEPNTTGKMREAYYRVSLTGTDEECRWYILCVEYGKAKGSGKAPLTLYYTNPLPKDCLSIPVLTDDGDLMMAGGSRDDNFTPSANVFLMHLGNQASSTKTEKSHSLWIWMLVFCAVLAIIAFALLRKNRIRRNRLSMNNTDQEGKAPQQDNNIAEKSLNDSAYDQLMQRINELMETQKPYLNSELKVSDIADIFGIHRNEISACINSQKGCTFSQYINGYRIEHAKRQLRESPMKKVHAIWMESGFASEQTFFRIFKSNTGMTPKEWISSQND